MSVRLILIIIAMVFLGCAENGNSSKTNTSTNTQTFSQYDTLTETQTDTNSQIQTVSFTHTQSLTQTQSSTQTQTSEQTQSITQTDTQTLTKSDTHTQTQTSIDSDTRTQSETNTQTSTDFWTDTFTQTQSETNTQSNTSTQTQSELETQTQTQIGDAVLGGTLFSKHCAFCHQPAQTPGEFIGVIELDVDELTYFEMDAYSGKYSGFNYSAENTELLSVFIEEQMIIGDCDQQCAKDIAEYLWGLKDGEVTQSDLDPQCDLIDEPYYGLTRFSLLTSLEYLNSLNVLFNNNLPSDVISAISKNHNNTIEKFDNHRYKKINESLMESYLKVGLALGDWVIDESLLTCTDAQTCIDEFLNNYAYVAFRKELSDVEKQTYSDLITSNESYQQGLKTAFQTLLMSPEFLYRNEQGTLKSDIINVEDWAHITDFELISDDTYILNDYEYLSALSFSLTGSTPTLEMLNSVKDGLWLSSQYRSLTINEMVDSAKAKSHFQNMIVSWFELNYLENLNRDQVEFNQEIRSAMKQEIIKTFEYVWGENLPFNTVYQGDFTFLNAALAQYYNLPFDDAIPDIYQLVDTTMSDRGGVLASGAFMSIHSHSNHTSPIKRAVSFRKDVLCQNPPLPFSLDDSSERDSQLEEVNALKDMGGLTTADYYHLQTSAEGTSCNSCHENMINPLFAMENFDHVGRLHEKVNGNYVQTGIGINGIENVEIQQTIDGGKLIGYDKIGNILLSDINDLAQVDAGLEFFHAKDLSQLLVSENIDLINQCFVSKSTRYYFGFTLNTDFIDIDEPEYQEVFNNQSSCYSQQLNSDFNNNNHNIALLIKQLAYSTMFRFRKTQQGIENEI